MKALKEYHIPYLGLKVGKHHFQFTLTHAFFDLFEFSEIENGTVTAEVVMEKQSTMLIFDFDLVGEVETFCDRCGDDLVIPISTQQRLIVKFGDQTGSTDEDILVLGTAEHAVDLSQYLYEYAHLALPARHIHSKLADCNQQSLAALEKYKVDQPSSSQWAALKNLNMEDPEDGELFEEEEE